MRNKTIVLFSLYSLLIVGITPLYAETVYVDDEMFEITMRTGPSSENKIIAMLATGSRLEVLEEKEGWLLVRTGDDKEGWIVKRYSSKELPKKVQIQRLQKKYDDAAKKLEAAAEKASVLEKENRELHQTMSTNHEELVQVKSNYTTLSMDAKNVIELKKNFTEATNGLNRARQEIEELKQENAELRSSTRLMWFLSGGGVVVGSWLVGFVMGRIKRKRRTQSLYT